MHGNRRQFAHAHPLLGWDAARTRISPRPPSKPGLDAVIVTDHNVLVQGVEGYYRVGLPPLKPTASCSWWDRKSTTRTVTRKRTIFWCSTPTEICPLWQTIRRH